MGRRRDCMTITKACPEHDGALAALEKICFSDPWPVDMIGRLREKFTVALDGETLMGHIVLSTVLDEGSIDNVAVSPAYRRCGVADALVLDAIARGRDMGLVFITLEVRAGNDPAIALYRKHGFVEVGRRKNYYEKPREDAILMTLVL